MRGTKEKEKRRKEKACVLRGGGRGEREREREGEGERGGREWESAARWLTLPFLTTVTTTTTD